MHDQETLEGGCHRQGEWPVGAGSAECLAEWREPGAHRLSCMAQGVEPPEAFAMQSYWLDQNRTNWQNLHLNGHILSL